MDINIYIYCINILSKLKVIDYHKFSKYYATAKFTCFLMLTFCNFFGLTFCWIIFADQLPFSAVKITIFCRLDRVKLIIRLS